MVDTCFFGHTKNNDKKKIGKFIAYFTSSQFFIFSPAYFASSQFFRPLNT